jgi:hypothetical protein
MPPVSTPFRTVLMARCGPDEGGHVADRAVDSGPAAVRPVTARRTNSAATPAVPIGRVAGTRGRDRAPVGAVPQRPSVVLTPPSPPPPRPAVGADVPRPPVAETPSRPRAVRGAAALWFVASAAGLFGVAMALADGDGLRDRLAATAHDTDPAATAEAVGDAVSMTILVVLGTVVGLAVLGLVWTAMLLRRRSWARWALLLTGLVTLFAADLAQSLVTGGPDLDRLSLLVQLCAVVVATGLLLARSTRAWLRRDATP